MCVCVCNYGSQVSVNCRVGRDILIEGFHLQKLQIDTYIGKKGFFFSMLLLFQYVKHAFIDELQLLLMLL